MDNEYLFIKITNIFSSHCRIIFEIRGIMKTEYMRGIVACRLVIVRLENQVCLINFRASMNVCFIAGASDIAAVGSNIGRKAGRQHYLLSEGERGRMPSP